MLRILGCLAYEHDLQLVLLAAAICVFGVAANLVVSDRAVRGTHRNVWLVLLALCGGSAVWATHFLAMLAYRSSVPMTYATGLTAASYLIGVAVMGIGFGVALRSAGNTVRALVGGAIVGAGVSALHFVGMAAMQFPGTRSYDADLVVAAVVLASAFGATAMHLMARPRREQRRLFAGLLLVAMVVSLHFTGMGALRLELGPTDGAVDGMSRSVLAVAVTGATLAVLMIAVAGAIMDQRVSRRLANEAERFRTLADGALEALIVHRDGVLVESNAAARRMFGLDRPGTLPSIAHWFAAPDGRGSIVLPIDEPTEMMLPGADGTPFPAQVCRRRIRLAAGGHGELLAIRDLTAQKRGEARIAHLALHDPLTELPNRRLFMELFDKAVGFSERSGERFAVLSIDLDGFKLVNDVHGHAAGDDLLRAVAARMLGELREADVLARFGGDEFVVLQGSATPPVQSVSLAERLLAVLSEPVRLPAAEVTISASIGVAIYPDDGRRSDILLRNADTAMYRAKADGKATCRFFEPQMDAVLEKRRRLELRLRQAVHGTGLQVVFQPLVDSESRQVRGFEALLRWDDAELGPIPPSDFIPVAEETGLIVPIGDFVLQRACHEAASWSRPLSVAVNLSVAQFRRKGLVETVARALAASGLPGERLELEVTESLLIENRDEALRTLRALKGLGARIAMDDFGTGYSSLSYLQSFPFDKIKIDRVFVAGLEEGTQNASIVRAVASMGRSLKMRVVAEGVETAEQARLLELLECDELQGYLIARPMPASRVEAFLDDSAATHDAGPGRDVVPHSRTRQDHAADTPA